MTNFEQKIGHLNAQGYTHHVFQEYGEKGDHLSRGHSKSFDDFESAKKYARKVPGGMVYDTKGNDVFFVGEDE
jgi:hypothetical protein